MRFQRSISASCFFVFCLFFWFSLCMFDTPMPTRAMPVPLTVVTRLIPAFGTSTISSSRPLDRPHDSAEKVPLKMMLPKSISLSLAPFAAWLMISQAMPTTPQVTTAAPTVNTAASAIAPQMPPFKAPVNAPAKTFPPFKLALNAPVSPPIIAPEIAPNNSPVGSARIIGLFSQYANILALRTPLTSVDMNVSAFMNLPVSGS